MIDGWRRHVMGYLEEFLFPSERKPALLVSTFRRRAIAYCAVLRPARQRAGARRADDDLDLETPELLEDLLLAFEGTLFLVSHDRELLNNVVDGTLALEPGGRVGEYAGGYDDWVRQRPTPNGATAASKPAQSARPAPPAAAPRPVRLTHKERQELDALPAAIEALESDQARLYARLADAGTYQDGGDEVVAATARLAEVEQELAVLFARWEALEGKKGDG